MRLIETINETEKGRESLQDDRNRDRESRARYIPRYKFTVVSTHHLFAHDDEKEACLFRSYLDGQQYI